MGTVLIDSGYRLPLSACRWLPSSSRSGRRWNKRNQDTPYLAHHLLEHCQTTSPTFSALSKNDHLLICQLLAAANVAVLPAVTPSATREAISAPTKLKLRHTHPYWHLILLYQLVPVGQLLVVSVRRRCTPDSATPHQPLVQPRPNYAPSIFDDSQ